MPTFFDSSADAAEALEALCGLAHASRGFDEPAQMYGVIGELSAAMRSLRQVLDQLADAHERETERAFDDVGDHEAGCGTRSLRRRNSTKRRTWSTGPTTGSRGTAIQRRRRACRSGESAWCFSRVTRPIKCCASSTSRGLPMRWTNSPSGTAATRPPWLR